MKVLIGLCLMSALNVGSPTAPDCNKWQGQVDPSVVYSGMNPVVSKVSAEEKVRAISCLMELEGRSGTAKFGGATRLDVSKILPEPSVEIAALFYIRFLYLAKWDHCNGIALMDKNGEMNTSAAVKKAYASYKMWFENVKVMGIDEARAKGIDPMDGCKDEVRWY